MGKLQVHNMHRLMNPFGNMHLTCHVASRLLPNYPPPPGKKSLRELQQLYFKIKEYVFANDRAGFAYNTEALEKLIKEEFGTDMVMQDVLFPRFGICMYVRMYVCMYVCMYVHTYYYVYVVCMCVFSMYVLVAIL